MMREARALAIAEAALDALTAAPEELARFMTETGVDADALRAAMDDPSAGAEAFAAVLTFMAADEPRAAAFCAHARLTPEEFAAARALLGGEAPHWT